MNKYERVFESIDGEEFLADVYSVLAAFGVKCPARQHAIKKLLMPGQRGAKSEIQDLDEALVSVSRAIDMARARLPDGGTLTGEPMVEPELEPEPESEPELATWQLCVRIEPEEVADAVFSVAWYRSDNIPEDWYSVVPYTQPVETVKKLPEGQKP
jgi:hypothetical protein